MSEVMSQTEKAADRIRGELLSTLKELDRRRQKISDARAQIQKYLPLVMAGAAGMLTLTGVVVTAVALVRRRRLVRRAGRERLLSLIEAWQHPDRVADVRAPSRRLSAGLAKKLLLAVAGAVVGRLAQKGFKSLLPRPSPLVSAARPYSRDLAVDSGGRS